MVKDESMNAVPNTEPIDLEKEPLSDVLNEAGEPETSNNDVISNEAENAAEDPAGKGEEQTDPVEEKSSEANVDVNEVEKPETSDAEGKKTQSKKRTSRKAADKEAKKEKEAEDQPENSEGETSETPAENDSSDDDSAESSSDSSAETPKKPRRKNTKTKKQSEEESGLKDTEKESAESSTSGNEKKPKASPKRRKTKKKDNNPKLTAQAKMAEEKGGYNNISRKDYEKLILQQVKPRKFRATGKENEIFTQESKETEQAFNDLDDTLKEILSASHNYTVLTSRVISTRNHPKYGASVVCLYGEGDKQYEVLIPYDRFTDKDSAWLSEHRLTKESYLSRKLGITVDFFPVGFEMEDGDYIFMGDRRLGMKIQAKAHWFSTETDHGVVKPKFVPSSLVEARVIGVYPKVGVEIELFGVETIIPLHEISYEFISPSLSNLNINAGDIIVVYITGVEKKIKGDMPVISFSASIKRTKPNPIAIAFKRLNVGDETMGTITAIKMTKKKNDITLGAIRTKIYIHMDGGGEAVCAVMRQGVKVGQRVSIKIHKKYISYDGSPKIMCSIEHYFN